MNTSSITPEVDVLITTIIWLHNRGVAPLGISIAQGQGIDAVKNKRRVLKTLEKLKIPQSTTQFVPDGPDIIGISQSECWKIECKGAGIGKGSTQRNNFDRALASVVSYYFEKLPVLPVGLAMMQTAVPCLARRSPQLESTVPN